MRFTGEVEMTKSITQALLTSAVGLANAHGVTDHLTAL
jgi:hypothetical protein